MGMSRPRFRTRHPNFSSLEGEAAKDYQSKGAGGGGGMSPTSVSHRGLGTHSSSVMPSTVGPGATTALAQLLPPQPCVSFKRGKDKAKSQC